MRGRGCASKRKAKDRMKIFHNWNKGKNPICMGLRSEEENEIRGKGTGAPDIFRHGGRGGWTHRGFRRQPAASEQEGRASRAPAGPQPTEEQSGKGCMGGPPWEALCRSDFCAPRPRPHPRKNQLDCPWCEAPLRLHCDTRAYARVPHVSSQLSWCINCERMK